MYSAIPANRFAAGIEVLCGLIARHGLARLLAGPLIVLIWGRVRTIGTQVETLLARLRAGRLRRFPARRLPRPATTPRRPPTPNALPRASGWLARLIPETAASAAQLQHLLAEPDIPALLQAAPQLRRALRPLCRMLAVSLPRSVAPPAAVPPANHPPPEPPPTPPPRRNHGPRLDAQAAAPHIPPMNPFVHPEDPTAADAIAGIADELSVFDDWMDRYQYIIELGRKLPAFPDAWANDSHRVPGCQSRVWMEAERRDGKVYLAGASDAAIVSGLVALLLRVYSGRAPAEIAATDPVFLKDLGLIEALSTNRGNGIAAMARKIREVAALMPAA